MDDPDTARWREIWPFTALMLAMALVLAAGGEHWLTPAALGADRVALADWAARHALVAPFAVAAAAAAAALLAVPGEAGVAIAGGLVHGAPAGALLAAGGATLGATALMLAARRALRPMLRRSSSRWLIGAEQALQRHGLWWLLALRLAFPQVPLLVTLLAAALGARTRDFALATGLGTLPGAFVMASAGAQMASAGPPGGDPLSAWPAPLVFAGLALAALLPILAAMTRRGRS